jgi:hypothetical protein
MRTTRIYATLAALAAALFLSPAQAVPITGGISFTDGLSTYGTTTSIVSALTAIDDDAATVETALTCSGSFAGCPAFGAFALDFTIAAGDQIIYSYGGFTFHLTSITTGPSAAPAFNCNGTGCADGLSFTGAGYVTGAGFDPTLITIAFTANGTCNQAKGKDECGGNVTASWSSSISSTGIVRQVPEPTTAALLGLGLLALGFSARRRLH